MIKLEAKLKVIKDWKGGKLLVIIAHQSGMSHSTMAMILKKRTVWQKLLKDLFHWRQWDKPKFEKAYVSYGGTSNDLAQKWIPLSTLTVLARASLFTMLKEKAGPSYIVDLLLALGGLSDWRIILHYIMWQWVVNLWDLMWGSWKTFINARWANCGGKSLPEQIFAMNETSLEIDAWEDFDP